MTTITMGDTTIESTDDGGNGNLLVAQKATLSAAATLQTLSFYVRTVGGSLNLGVYDATGPGGNPGHLLATAGTFTPKVGWNTVPVITQVVLTAGTYWLAYFPSSNNLGFQNTNSGNEVHIGRSFGALPATFPTSGLNSGGVQWSFYASLATTVTPPPPPPPPPPGLVATVVSATEIDLSWPAVTGAAGYDVFRNGVKIATVTTTSYADTGLTAATQYSYTMDSFSIVFTAQSAAVVATTQVVPPPPPPPPPPPGTMSELLKNTANQNFTFALVNTSDAPLTGASVTVRVSIDGGAQILGTGHITELGNGVYNYAPTQGETNGDCVSFFITAPGAIPENLMCLTSGLHENVAGQHVTFVLFNTTGAADPNATVTVWTSSDGGAQTLGGGLVTNLGNGQYDYAPTQAETNGTNVSFLFSATGDVIQNLSIFTVP